MQRLDAAGAVRRCRDAEVHNIYGQALAGLTPSQKQQMCYDGNVRLWDFIKRFTPAFGNPTSLKNA